MPAAARVGDDHLCTLTNPNGSPHKGGPIQPPGIPNVLIGGQAAATVGSICLCAGPPDSIVKGSLTVTINGQAAARQNDKTAHGGTISAGCTSVIIGD
jgi:uncharacterized Zn-binding protein involved in type VI secretion